MIYLRSEMGIHQHNSQVIQAKIQINNNSNKWWKISRLI